MFLLSTPLIAECYPLNTWMLLVYCVSFNYFSSYFDGWMSHARVMWYLILFNATWWVRFGYLVFCFVQLLSVDRCEKVCVNFYGWKLTVIFFFVFWFVLFLWGTLKLGRSEIRSCYFFAKEASQMWCSDQSIWSFFRLLICLLR